mgnify:CR=1 FL=1
MPDANVKAAQGATHHRHAWLPQQRDRPAAPDRHPSLGSASTPLADVVTIHDGRNCDEWKDDGSTKKDEHKRGRWAFQSHGYATAGDQIFCTKLNNGLTSGSGEAYARLVDAMLTF